MKRGILFDLDGTLWDSSREVAISWQQAIAKRPDIETEVTTEMVQGVMGKSMDEIADIIFAGYGREKRREFLAYCEEEENEYIRLHGGQLLEGLLETLQILREQGYHLYIVSNCQTGYIEAFLEHHKLGEYFEDFESFGGTGKEKSYNIRLVATRNHLDEAVYVGDTQGDYEAASKAGLPFIHAKTGYGTVKADVPCVEKLPQLPGVVSGMSMKFV